MPARSAFLAALKNRGSRTSFGPVRQLAVVFGDQLNALDPVITELDAKQDAVLLMEVASEAEFVPAHRQRTALFLSAMRHFAVAVSDHGLRVRYVRLDDPVNTGTFEGEVRRAVAELVPEEIVCQRPGEWRVWTLVDRWKSEFGIPVHVRENTHFLIEPADFTQWAAGRRELVLEYFYRWMRKKFSILMKGDKPEGGAWNFDKENREPFRGDPKSLPEPLRFPPDEITREVLELVERRWPSGYGELADFAWPVTAGDAKRALTDFLEQRLANFGRYQDAMVTGSPWMFHSLLSPALNLQLLDPRDCLAGAVHAWECGAAPLAAVEGFVRQILGWREFIRGVYWHAGPEYGSRNGLGETGQLPEFYWTGQTDMRCLSESVGEVVRHGYGHHIQRLMVTGNFALIAGIHPRAISDWYLGMYVDAVDWVTLPNTLGMVMHADGGVVGTKPYAASGKYIERMSDYCDTCVYDPALRVGPTACPFTTFYWDFLIRHRETFRDNRRMAMILVHVDRMSDDEKNAIREHAAELRRQFVQ
jgi:deoxyribodipyrimidine photolyase-related protein